VAQLAEHPSVKHFYEDKAKQGEAPTNQVLDAAWLRKLCLDAGADDVGFVERERPEIADQKVDIENVFPRTRTLISVVCRMNRENIRTPARSISNLEFHHTTDETNEVARRIVTALEELGIAMAAPRGSRWRLIVGDQKCG
jgi:transcriptional/translational regulatory protein YebC/TACO1